ncbi:hypothetical protein BAY61_17510 [Prauserella marina]|uniref:Uncharacterized protein n=1 Tax=Prauserella marina TaxID=530584 RepID=A0A222VRI4_9PSEU|nr:hypothetical protein [Prauserella marina]ASR36504.1 hypothetical protein BAY61_17510 [Prauserella marina]PWV73886.1 hypothetical protein DES30_10859 [Prauserella marina]SDD58220.1 hypothetical protein SAMN05421630_11059 [Prauserella marina]
MNDRRTQQHVEGAPCPVCGVPVGRRPPYAPEHSPIDDPMLTTPSAKLCAVALEGQIRVFDVPVEASEGFGGAVAAGMDDDGSVRGMVGLAEDLDDDLRADVLAFGIAVLAGAMNVVTRSPNGYLAIGRTRLPAAPTGVGHLAWHMARTCGRDTPSATFELVSL